MAREGTLAIVKWAGGKRQLLSQFEERGLFPKEFNNYHEPFVGAGAVMLHLKQTRDIKNIFISDINEELMNAYDVIRDNVDELIDELKAHTKKHTEIGKEFYLAVRAMNPYELDKVAMATRFIYLNRTCFNGLYRVNSKGGFNVPMGTANPVGICQEDALRKISKLLKGVKAKAQTFESVLGNAKKGDFIYFDPPYDPLKKTSFTTYAKDGFGDVDQAKLAEVFKELDKKGCHVMLSNNNTDFVKTLYEGYNFHHVLAKRSINSKAEGRGKIKEVVITNY